MNNIDDWWMRNNLGTCLYDAKYLPLNHKNRWRSSWKVVMSITTTNISSSIYDNIARAPSLLLSDRASPYQLFNQRSMPEFLFFFKFLISQRISFNVLSMESRRSTIFSDQYATGGALKSTFFNYLLHSYLLTRIKWHYRI